MTAQKTNLKIGNIVNISSYARCTVRPNKWKSQGLEQRKVYCKEKSSFCPKNLNSRKGLDKALLKARWGACITGVTLSVLRLKGLELCVQAIYIFCLLRRFFFFFPYICKTAQEIFVHQILFLRQFREVLKQRIWGEGLFQEGPVGSCLVILSRLVKAFLADTFIFRWGN